MSAHDLGYEVEEYLQSRRADEVEEYLSTTKDNLAALCGHLREMDSGNMAPRQMKMLDILNAMLFGLIELAETHARGDRGTD
jgi:hypothetical protein